MANRNKCIVLLLTVLALCIRVARAQDTDTSTFNPDAVGVTLQQVLEHYREKPEEDNEDTGEGGRETRYLEMQHLWSKRVIANNDASLNMFAEYEAVAREAIQARYAGNCTNGSEKFHGAWQCIGPNKLPTQNLGYVECVWADPSNANVFMAGTLGGIFKTTNGGLNWKNITDGTPIVNGVFYITSIASSPTSSNNMCASTSGGSLLVSTNGGTSWSQELVGPSGASVFDAFRKVIFTPDGNTIILIKGEHIYVRPTSSPGSSSWVEITTSSNNPFYGGSGTWRDLEFVPNVSGNSNYFFVSSVGFNNAAIYKFTKSGSTWSSSATSTPIFISGATNNSLGVDYAWRIEMSIPDGQYMFAGMMQLYTGGSSSVTKPNVLARYNLSTGTWTTVSTGQIPGWWIRGEMVVSPQKVQNVTNGPFEYNIYAGDQTAAQSYDGGQSFQTIGTYYGNPTHGDIRHIVLQQGTNSMRGINDRVVFATDGGVSCKKPGSDALVNGANTLSDISGTGLACGEFTGVATSEASGVTIGDAWHNGFYNYESAQSPTWVYNQLYEAYGFDGGPVTFDEANKNMGWYTSSYNGLYDKTNTGTGTGRKITGLNGSSNSFPFETDAIYPLWTDHSNRQYTGQRNLYVKPNGTTTWQNMSNNPIVPSSSTFKTNLFYHPDSKILSLAFNPYNTGSFPDGYVSFDPLDATKDPSHNSWKIYKINPTASTGSTAASGKSIPGSVNGRPVISMTTDPGNINRVWISIGGITGSGSAGKDRIFYSSNGGSSWQDVSSGLPDRIPATQIIFQEGSQNLYASTDAGMFKMDFSSYNASAPLVNGVNTSATWICFNKPLVSTDPDFPNVGVTQLAINYCDGKLYASTYGRSIWSTDIMVDDPNYYTKSIGDHVPDQTVIISANATWSSERYIYTGIRVKSGKTLTINNTGSTQTVIHMPKNGALVVEPGATLIVDGARITNECSGFWKGILVCGTPNLPQTNASAQGKAYIKNGAVIEYARLAVANYGESVGAPNGAGGIIDAQNSFFYNNARGIGFAPYHNYYNNRHYANLSLIKGCTFDITNSYRGYSQNYGFQAHINMSNVDEINIRGNVFKNSSTTKGGYGITSWSSSFYVIPYCPGGPGCATSSYVHNTFEGFQLAIKTDDASIHPLDYSFVDYADFTNNGVGIYANYNNWCQIFRNTFTLQKNGVPYDASCKCQKGVYLIRTPQFRIEENTFSKNSATGTLTTYGAQIDNSGPISSTIYRNTFRDMYYATRAIGTNGTFASQLNDAKAFVGLDITCNSYAGHAYGICVDAGAIIRMNQGSKTSSAEDRFTYGYPSYDLYVDNAGTTFRYWVGYISSATYPYNVKNISTSLASQPYNTCAQRGIVTPPYYTNGTYYRVNAQTNFQAAKNVWQSGVAALQQRIDAGNYQEMFNKIYSGFGPPLRDTLLSYAPYLSDRILRETMASNRLPKPDMMTLMMANPDVLHEGLYAYIRNVAPGMYTEDDIDTLKAHSANITDRTADQTLIDDAYENMTLAHNDIIGFLKTDTNGLEIDTLAFWYKQLPVLWPRYATALMYLGTKDYDKSQSAMNEIASDFVLTGDSLDVYNSYQDVMNIMKTAYQSDRTELQFDSTELAELQTIADRGHGDASHLALTLYNQNLGIVYMPCVSSDDTASEGDGGGDGSGARLAPPITQSGPATNNSNNTATISAYPNPAREKVSFTYNASYSSGEITLIVTNLNGQTVFRKVLTARSGTVEWLTAQVTAGNYLYQITDGKKKLATGKLSIVK